MLAIYLVFLGIVGHYANDLEEEKAKKRRNQNMESARKSYVAKKNMRQRLEQRHAELEETQKELLHSKFRLESTLRMLQHVACTMVHAYSTCNFKNEVEQARSQLETNRQNSSDDNTCHALDLSVKCQRSCFHQDKLSTHSRQNPSHYNNDNSILQVKRTNRHLADSRVSFIESEVDLSSNVSKSDATQDVGKIIKQEIDIKQKEVDNAPFLKKIKLEPLVT